MEIVNFLELVSNFMKLNLRAQSYDVMETLSDVDCNVLGEFQSEKEARNFFKEVLKVNGGKSYSGLRSHELELRKIIFDEDGDIDSFETIDNQFLYNEGTMDRAYYAKRLSDTGKPYSIDYGYSCYWDATEQELIYTFYGRWGEEDEIFLESELQNWHYK